MSKTFYGSCIHTFKGDDYILLKDHTKEMGLLEKDLEGLRKSLDEIQDNSTWIKIKGASSELLYDVLSREMCFNEVINLYKLLKYKIEHLDDEPRKYNDKCAANVIADKIGGIL